jgi:ribosome biogenesis GTPase / thiamine phosphate phosphatase
LTTPTLSALVVETQRRHFIVEVAGERVRCIAKGRDQSIACGDLVSITRERDGAGVIESVDARSSVFYRADEFKEKIVAANVTQVLCVVAADPPYADELLARWLIAAAAADTRAIIVCNKMDLESAAATLASLKRYEALGTTLVPLSAKQDASALLPHLQGQRSVLIGQSGMGKSSIINALFGDEIQRIGPLSILRNAGTHTTTHSRLFAIPNAGITQRSPITDGWLIDSPGMQVFGVAHLSFDTIERAFPDFQRYIGHCRFRNCRHRNEPDCALKNAVSARAIDPIRLALFQSLTVAM